MKKYIKPELEIIDLSAKELLMNGEYDPLLDPNYEQGDISLPDGWT